MSYSIKLTEKAAQDLDGIIEYTCRQWGAEQVDSYMARLGGTIDQLREQPSRQGRSLDELKPGLRYLQHQQHHFVFYRVEGRRVEIIRIIHQRRDWRRLLDE